MPASPPTRLAPRVTELLDQLRRRIRGYVWLEGIALAITWVAATFWIGLAVDYLPVRVGASEMPVAARATLLACVGVTLLYILYRWVLRRAFVRLRYRSLAILVERQYPQFQDSLVTAVELDELHETSSVQQEMLHQARAHAIRHVGEVQLEKVFNYWPLRRALALASLSLASVALLAFFCRPAFGLWVSRLYGLSETTYPRQTYLEMIGFLDGQVTVARGSDVTVRVRADASRPVPPPDVCSILYRTVEGERGRTHMSKRGAPQDGFQQYTFTGKPFKSILNDIVFDVVGNDQRIRDQRVRVVDSPQIVSVELACDRPAYTQLASINLAYYPGIPLPRGSRLTVRMKANKPLIEARLKNLEDDSQQVLTPVATGQGDTQPNFVAFDVPSFDADLRQEVTLTDTDGVTSTRPYRLAITATPDQPPDVVVRLRGIGSAITSSARLPVTGEISDDYGVADAWFQLELPDETRHPFELAVQPGGKVDTALDLRQQRAAEDGLQLQDDSKVLLSVFAADLYDLEELPHTGQGDRYELEVVSPNRLVALLEARELGLRRRFEQIISEMQETRDSLSRVQFTETEGGGNHMLLDEVPSQPTSPAERARRAASLRQLRVQRAEQSSQRAAQEVLGVALSFDDIRQELINNRVDAGDRRDRIQRDISQPLQRISEDRFPILDRRLTRLRQNLESEQPARDILASAAAAVAQADEILVAMEAVLEKMLDLETYNELVDLIRAMIRDQEELTEKTKQQRKDSALELLK